MSLLSVVIPVYNGEECIIDTINRILNGSFENLEILVVDDGSKDRSVELVRSIQKNDSRIKLYIKENGGVASSRNFGIENATGRYICFVDQDDFVKKDMYRKLIEKMENDESEIGICSSGRWIEGKEIVHDIQNDKLYSGDAIREKLLIPILFNSFDMPGIDCSENHYPQIWTCVFEREFLLRNKIRFRAYVNFEDDLLVKAEALSRASKVSTISYVGYLWRVNLTSETYAHHFVENIGEKQDEMYLDLKESLEFSAASVEEVNLFKKAMFCKQFIDAIHNLTSPEVIVNRKFISEYCKKNIYSRDFEEVIAGRRYIKKGRVKLRVLLPLIAWKRTYLSYYMELLLDKVLMITLHSKILTKAERGMKKG